MVDFNVTYDGRSYPFRLPDDQFERFKNMSKADQRKRAYALSFSNGCNTRHTTTAGHQLW